MVKQVMSDLEEIVYNWLSQKKINFQFQSSLAGGYYALGGAVIDFILENRIALRVHGEYWHRGVVPEGRDLMQKEILTAQGFIVVDLWGEDLKSRLDETMQRALSGEEMLR